MQVLPRAVAEIHALLLTDVVDSTRLAEQLGDVAMADLWARHDRVARDLLAAHGGREIDKTDGFLLLFAQATEAVAYAAAYHRALRPLGLQARAGLHVGPVILRENAPADVARGAKPLEVEGLAKPVAARVMGLASAGQTLCTAEAADASLLRPMAADAAAPSSVPVLLAHGHWMLKGLLTPVPLFEVGIPGEAPMTPPSDAPKAWRVVWLNEAWIPVRDVAHSLPRERDAFVGREADLQELARRLDDGAALISVLGFGGTGKTRLVTRYGWTWLGSWPGGVWFCDLADARGVDGIAFAVAKALDAPLGKDDPITQLGHAIASRGRCLVLLDNFEQLARFGPETLGAWLDRAPEAQFVVTSREVLGLPGETILALAPLVAAEAVDLFVARAVQAKRDFVLTDGERPAVVELVRLLDGLPLAIELAAARVRVMPPKVLLQRMSERFKLLASTGGRPGRQATLRATLDWSWELLSPDEQAALAQLSVFEGGFTLEAAQDVLSLSEMWPMDAVQALVDRSLVRRVSEERFDLLVSVQEYASEKVAGGRAAAEARHGAHFAGRGAPEALAALDVHGGAERRWALAAEAENLVAACRRAVARGAGAEAVRILRATWAVVAARGPQTLGAELARSVLALPLNPSDRAAAGLVLARALLGLGRYAEALPHLEAALVSFRAAGDLASEASALLLAADVHQHHRRPEEASACREAALAAARASGSPGIEARALRSVGALHNAQSRPDDARAAYESALRLCREVGDGREECAVLSLMGNLQRRLGRLDEARATVEAELARAREIRDPSLVALALSDRANHLRLEGRMDEARQQLEQALDMHRAVGNRRAEANVLGDLANVHDDQGRADAARTHYEAAAAVAREIGDHTLEALQMGNLGILHFERGEMDRARPLFEAALASNRAVGDRRGEGIWLGNLANLHLLQRSWDEALAHFEAALTLARQVGNRRSEGSVLNNLGQLHLTQGRRREAREHFDASEIVLRALRNPMELCTLMAHRAHLEHDEGHTEAALAALAEAEACAAQVGTIPGSDLDLMIRDARAWLGLTPRRWPPG